MAAVWSCCREMAAGSKRGFSCRVRIPPFEGCKPKAYFARLALEGVPPEYPEGAAAHAFEPQEPLMKTTRQWVWAAASAACLVFASPFADARGGGGGGGHSGGGG